MRPRCPAACFRPVGLDPSAGRRRHRPRPDGGGWWTATRPGLHLLAGHGVSNLDFSIRGSASALRAPSRLDVLRLTPDARPRWRHLAGAALDSDRVANDPV